MSYLLRLAGLSAMAMSLQCSAAVCAAQGLAATPTSARSVWEQPAAALAGEIADAMGPGQARLVIRNNSTIAADEIPAIEKLLEQDLKSHGVVTSGAESANAIRVTLSENLRERLWVAEVIEGSETHVVMVGVGPGAATVARATSGMTLRKQMVIVTKMQVLATLETATALIAVEPEAIAVYNRDGDGWQPQRRVAIERKRAMARDPRAILQATQGGDGFEAMVPGAACLGSFGAGPSESWPVRCRESDDPWPILRDTAGTVDGGYAIKAFYNSARDSFTGVVTPSVGVDLPAFYSAALLPRPGGAGLLIGGIDGRVQMAENGALKTVSGTRDWGSDFAVLQHSACGESSLVIASGSGEAKSDSLRAYEIPALEAVPASAALAMDGMVTAIWSAPDGKSVMTVVRHASGEYEVDRVTALCN